MSATGDPFRPVRPGEALNIQARAWNALLRNLANTQQIGGAGAGAGLATANAASTIRVLNASGAPLAARLGVLGIDGVAITPDDGEASFLAGAVVRGVVPVTGTHDAAFVVVVAPLAAGAVGTACIAGVFPALVNITSAGHPCATIKNGDATRLASAAEGPVRILYRAASTGSAVLCLVALSLAGTGGGGPSFGKITAKTSGTTYTVSLYANGYRFATTTTGLSVDCENTLSAETLANGTRVMVRQLPGGTYEGTVIGAQLS